MNAAAKSASSWTEAAAAGARARRRAAAERQRAKLLERQPKHVRHCWHQGARDWWVYSWLRERPATAQRTAYHCESWRCEKCRRFDASVQFARIRQASEGLERKGWVFLTLTVPRRGVKGWRAVDEVFKDLSRRNRNFFARLRRFCKARGWRALGNQWVGVVEAHRSGWPHMHFALWCPELAAWLRDNPQAENLLPEELAVAAVDCGWGERCSVEPARSQDALAGYLTKLAGEAGELTGELAKLTQLPTTAPVRFRRLRAGKGFLPPRKKNPAYTGTLVRRRLVPEGHHVEPIHRVRENPIVEHLCGVEERRAGEHYAKRIPEPPTDCVPLPPHVIASYNAAMVSVLDARAGRAPVGTARDGPARAKSLALRAPP